MTTNQEKIQSANIPPVKHVKVLNGQGWIGIIDQMGTESTITNAARVSFGKMKETFDDKDKKLLKYLIENKHLTPLEHVRFTFSVHCPLFIARQWHRHRMESISEISRRYTEVDIQFYIPKEYRVQSDSNKQASIAGSVIDNNNEAFDIYSDIVNECFSAYKKLLNLGVCKEQARGILPQTMFTTFWATMDLRNLLHFIELRDDNHAQAEIKEYAQAIKTLIKDDFPNIANIFNW